LIGKIFDIAGGESGMEDGNGSKAKFHTPRGLCFDEESQSVLVCDINNNNIRRISKNGTTRFSQYSIIFLNFFIGDVTTLCSVEQPCCAAVMSNQIILVTTYTNRIYAIYHHSISFFLSPQLLF
jgi:hypothetical protein